MSNYAQQWAWELQEVMRLPPTTHHVLLCIAEHLNDKTETAWPTYERICARTGLSERAVRNAVRHLEQLDVVTVESRTTAGGRKIGNVYRLPSFDPAWARERKSASFDPSGVFDPSRAAELGSILEPAEPSFQTDDEPWAATAF